MTAGLSVVLFGDGAWAAEALRGLQDTPHRVLGVVLRDRPGDASLGDTARGLDLPVLRPTAVNGPSVLEQLRSWAPDLGLSIAYNQIFRRALLEIPRLGFLNFHAGMLPNYRGRNVINWAIINGERELGLTAHFVDEGIDTGDLLLQRRIPIDWTDGYGDVLCRAVQAMPSLVVDALDLVAGGRYTRTPQPKVGTYFAGRGEGDEWLDWSDSSVNLHNKVRAITRPGPGARTISGGRRIIVWRAYCDPAWPKYLATPGQVVGREREGVLVKTGDSTLLLQEVQDQGGAPYLPAWPIGTRLGAASLHPLGTDQD
jgi:methionyl-tRNA formyltransferase